MVLMIPNNVQQFRWIRKKVLDTRSIAGVNSAVGIADDHHLAVVIVDRKVSVEHPR